MVEHHGFAEGVEAELGGVIGRAAGEGVLAGEAADVDDVTAALLAEAGECLTAAVERAGEVEVQGGLPVFNREIGNGFEDADSGVVDQDIQLGKVLFDVAEECCYFVGISDVGMVTDGCP
jgi:hypothetical protein